MRRRNICQQKFWTNISRKYFAVRNGLSIHYVLDFKFEILLYRFTCVRASSNVSIHYVEGFEFGNDICCFTCVRAEFERWYLLRSGLKIWKFVKTFYVRYNRGQALVFTPFRASNLEMCFIILGNLEQSSSISIHYVQGFSIEKVLFYFMFVREDLER